MNHPDDQKSLLLWYAFTAQGMEAMKEKLEATGIIFLRCLKTLHLLQPLDLTTNSVFKKQGRLAFSDFYTSVIMKELNDNPERDVTTIKVDTKLSTMEPLHIQTLEKIYKFFVSSNQAFAGWCNRGCAKR